MAFEAVADLGDPGFGEGGGRGPSDSEANLADDARAT